MKKNIISILIIISLFVFQFVYALENMYPDILGYEITKKSEFVDYVSYIFAFLISIGGIILIAVIMMAGIDFILAGGDPSKVSHAKKRIKDGFIGLIILLFSYLILNTINPAILGIENPNLEKCVGGGIILTIEKPDENPKKLCIWETQSKIDIDGDIIGIEWTFKDGQLKEVWIFDDYDFKTNPTMIFQDNEYLDDKPLDPDNLLPISKDMKSIFILRKSPGLYLYDKINWGVENHPPLFVGLQNFSDMNNVRLDLNNTINYSDKTSSYRFIGDKDSPNMVYRGILFEDVNYSGKCYIAGQQVGGPTGVAMTGESFLSNGDGPGDNAVSSVITIKNYTGHDYGKITAYKNNNCTSSRDEDRCVINIGDYIGYNVVIDPIFYWASSFPNPCPSFTGYTWDIKSISIEGKAGFVIRANNNYCMYFDAERNKGSNCINLENTKVFYESGYNPDTGESIKIRPMEIMVFPIEK